MKDIRPIDANGLLILLEKEMDMNCITDWRKGYMYGIRAAIQHVKFIPTIDMHIDERFDDDCK